MNSARVHPTPPLPSTPLFASLAGLSRSGIYLAHIQLTTKSNTTPTGLQLNPSSETCKIFLRLACDSFSIVVTETEERAGIVRKRRTNTQRKAVKRSVKYSSSQVSCTIKLFLENERSFLGWIVLLPQLAVSAIGSDFAARYSNMLL